MEQKFKERRKHPRLSLALPIRLQWVDEEGRVFHKSYRSENVSTGGVYYKADEELPLGADVMVTFDLPSNDLVALRILSARGKVVRIEDADLGRKGIALKFTEDLKFSTLYNDH